MLGELRMSSSVFVENGYNIGDGLDLLKSLSDESAAIVFFDPQYRGVFDHLALGNEDAKQPRRLALQQMTEDVIKNFIQEIGRVLRPNGHFFLWLDKFHLVSGGLSEWVEGCPLKRVDMIVWDKGRIGNGYRSRRSSEYLIVLQRLPGRAKGCWKDHSIRDVWPEKAVRGFHPHEKPLGLQSRLIASCSDDGDLIVDPAAGSYSVLKACNHVGGRRFIGSDIEYLPSDLGI